MNTARSIMRLPSGRRTKWLILVFWVIVVVALGPLASKLTGAEKNDSQAWLPAKAESTKVLNLQSSFQSPNIFPGVVVYSRPSGLTAADKAKATADARRFATVHGVVASEIQGPIVARDGRAIETVVPVNLGKNGWNQAGTGGREASIHRAEQRSRRGHLHRRAAGHGGRLVQGVQGDRQHAAVRHAGGGHHLAADHLPEPGAVAAAGAVGRHLADRGPGAHLPAGRARRADRQRADAPGSCTCWCSARAPTTRCC